MALITAASIVHPTASSGHTRVAVLDSPARGVFELRDHGDRPNAESRKIWRGAGRREAERRLEGWLAYHRTLGYRDQLALPSGWQGYVAAQGGLADAALPVDRLGRWSSVPIEGVSARVFAATARGGEHRIERLPAPLDELRRAWLVIHVDGSYELRDVETLRILRPAPSLGKQLLTSAHALRSSAPLVIELAVAASDGRLAGPVAALDLLLAGSRRIAASNYDERRTRLGALLERLAEPIPLSEQISLAALKRLPTAEWGALRLVPASIPYDGGDAAALQLVVG